MFCYLCLTWAACSDSCKPRMKHQWSWVSEASVHTLSEELCLRSKPIKNKTLLTFGPVQMVTSYSGTQCLSVCLVSPSPRTLPFPVQWLAEASLPREVTLLLSLPSASVLDGYFIGSSCMKTVFHVFSIVQPSPSCAQTVTWFHAGCWGCSRWPLRLELTITMDELRKRAALVHGRVEDSLCSKSVHPEIKDVLYLHFFLNICGFKLVWDKHAE